MILDDADPGSSERSGSLAQATLVRALAEGGDIGGLLTHGIIRGRQLAAAASRRPPVALRAFLGALILCLSASTVAAQAVRVTLTDSATGSPIGGAIVTLVSSDGQPAVRGLSSTNGQRVLTAPEEGSFRIQVRRIGQAPFLSAPILLRNGSTAVLPLALPARPVVLPMTTITGSTSCPSIDDAGGAAAMLWTEARTALTTSELTRAERLVKLRVTTVQRTLDRSGRARAVDTLASQVSDGRPFESESAEWLSREGWVVPTGARSWDFFAPDERVLLSEEFARDHCFGVARDSVARPGAVALSFRPAPGRSLADISGFLWLDSATAELRELEFTFEQTGIPGAPRDIGGRVRFARLASGAWIIPGWVLRMPLLSGSTGRGGGIHLTGYRELSGSAVPTTTAADSALLIARAGSAPPMTPADSTRATSRACAQPMTASRLPTDTLVIRSGRIGSWGADPALLVPEVRYDSDGRGPMLGRVAYVATAADGQAYVYDETAGVILAYDSAGIFLHEISPSGGSGADYSRLHGMGMLPDGSLALWDFGHQKVDVVTPSGAVLRSWPLHSRLSTGAMYVDRRGCVLVEALLSSPDADPWVLGLIALDPASGALDTLVSPVQAGHSGVATYFEPVGLWTWHGDGFFVGGRNDRYALTLLPPRSAAIRIEHDHEPVPVGAAERAELGAMSVASGPERRSIPAVKPAYATIDVATDGRLWVRRQRRVPSFEAYCEAKAGVRTEAERVVREVFEADGRYLGEVGVPDDVRIITFGRDQLWGVTRTTGGVVTLVRYGVER